MHHTIHHNKADADHYSLKNGIIISNSVLAQQPEVECPFLWSGNNSTSLAQLFTLGPMLPTSSTFGLGRFRKRYTNFP
jgi:hypothetical protein